MIFPDKMELKALDKPEDFQDAALAIMKMLCAGRERQNHRDGGLNFTTAIMVLMSCFVGPIPDDEWDKFMEESGIACGDIDCDCHIRCADLFSALDTIRKTYKKIQDNAIKENESKKPKAETRTRTNFN